MPTSNISFRLPIEPSEYEQLKEIAEEQGLDLTQFIRLAVREKITALGHKPSSYEYKSGQKKAKGQ